MLKDNTGPPTDVQLEMCLRWVSAKFEGAKAKTYSQRYGTVASFDVSQIANSIELLLHCSFSIADF